MLVINIQTSVHHMRIRVIVCYQRRCEVGSEDNEEKKNKKNDPRCFFGTGCRAITVNAVPGDAGKVSHAVVRKVLVDAV